jgi:hypothetical protein
MPATAGRVNPRMVLENDAKREMERAAGPDERPRELQVCTRVDEEPCVLVAEAEEPELLEAPADDALILERELDRLGWVLRRHVPAETTR